VKLLARFLVVVGAVAVGWVLFGEGPKDVVLAYDLPASEHATVLEVELRRGKEPVRRAEFRLPSGGGSSRSRQVRHEVRLPEGAYELGWRLEGPGGRTEGVRALSVREDGTIVLSLGR